jgi:hypothetical protein
MDFLSGLLTGDLASTFRVGHPGVTTTLCGSLGAAIQNLAWTLQISSPPAGWSEGLGSAAQLIPSHIAGSLTPLRLPVALATSLGLVGMYFLASRLFGRRAALLGAFLVALEPFFLAHSRFLHTDALLSTFLTLSILSLAVWMREARRPFLILSGIAAGLAFLTKSSAVFLLPAAFLTVLIHSRHDLKKAILSLVFWGLVAVAAFSALWPAMWVDPLGTIMAVWQKALFESGGGHILYFLGDISMDPGPAFYPLVLLARATPLTLIGATLAAIVAFRDGKRDDRGSMGFLAACILGFALFVTINQKKQDRYLLPVFPMLGFIAAVGWVGALQWILEEAISRLHRPLSRTALLSSAAGIILLLQAASSLPTAPYYLTYYSPAVGGIGGARELIQIGWGEGMNLAADYLNSLPHGAHKRVAASYSETFQPLFQGETIAPDALMEADYAVLYLSEVQRGRPSQWVISLLSNQEPEHVVRLGDIEYAWIYDCSDLTIYADSMEAQYLVDITFIDGNAEKKVALLGDDIRFIGYDVEATARAGDTLLLTLYWEAREDIPEDYTVFTHLLDGSSKIWGQHDGQPAEGFLPTTSWITGMPVRDPHRLPLPADMPLGEYQIEVGLYLAATGERLPVTDEQGTALGDRILLESIRVEAR